MPWRKWLVRGLVFTTMGALIVAGCTWQAWTNPEAVRRLVLAKLSDRYPDAVISLQSAQMQMFGGIALSELRLSRKGDPDQAILVYVPSGVIYPDKEGILNGRFSIRKVELNRPFLHLVRDRDGSLNVKGLISMPPLSERAALCVVRQGTMLVEDRGAAPNAPLVEIKNINLTIVNDPLTTLRFQGTGQCDVAGALKLQGSFRRDTGETSATVEAPSMAVGPTFVQRLASLAPDAAVHLRQLRGSARVVSSFSYTPGASRPLSYDVNAHLTGGEFSHAMLPGTISHLDATVRCANGHISRAQFKGEFEGAQGELNLTNLTLPTNGAPVSLEEAVAEMDGKIEHLSLTDKHLAYLPASVKDIKTDYNPSGPLSISYAFKHDADGKSHKHWTFALEQMSGTPRVFPYPVSEVEGKIERDVVEGEPPVITVDLVGRASGRRVTIKGKILGEKAHDGLDLFIDADNVPLDDKLLAALPEQQRELASKFHLHGKADIRAEIHRLPGGESTFKNHFVIQVHEASTSYSVVPYTMTDVSGVLEIFPDRHWECRNFSGRHGAGLIQLNGKSTPPSVLANGQPGPEAERMRLYIRGTAIPLDESFEEAIAPAAMPERQSLRNTLRILHFSGQADFTSQIIDHGVDHGPVDLDVTVTTNGASMRPRFFDYALDRVSGTVRYAHSQVVLSDVRAQHGNVYMGLKEGQIFLQPGGYQAYLRNDAERPLVFQGLTVDSDLLQALPAKLRRGLEATQIQGPFNLATALVVTVTEPGADPEIWWDGIAALSDNAIHAGLELTGIRGRVACSGLCKNQQLDKLSGNLLIDQLTALGQPLNAVQAQFEVSPKSNDVLRFRNVNAEMFGGTIGGEALLNFNPIFTYELIVKAMSIKLEPLGKHNNFGPDVEVQGPLSGGLYLKGDGSGITSLHGGGQIDVPNGKLYRLPLLLSLLQAFGLRLPADRTAFEQAHAKFTIEGQQAKVTELELIGNAISLTGQGTLNLDGSDLNLDFTATWGRLRQLLPSLINELPGMLSGQLLKIKMRGKLGDVRFEKELVPAVTAPVKRVFGG